MALITKAIKGTQDILPAISGKRRFVENSLFEIAGLFGFKEIRTPVFEHTELFQRGVGDTTDVVQKEMYTFDDKGGRSITLRPEGTAGVVRSFLENGLFNEALPQKLFSKRELLFVVRISGNRPGKIKNHAASFLKSVRPADLLPFSA